MSAKSILRVQGVYKIETKYDFSMLLDNQEAIEFIRLVGSPYLITPFSGLSKGLRVNVSFHEDKIERLCMAPCKYLFRVFTKRTPSISFVVPKRVVKLFLPGSRVYCFNYYAHLANNRKGFIRLPIKLLQLNVVGTNISRVPCSLVIHLDVSLTCAFKQQKTRESIITLSQAVPRKNLKTPGLLNRRSNLQLSPFIPKSTMSLCMEGFPGNYFFIHRGVFGTSIYNNIYHYYPMPRS